jgi:hypothetical protein
VVRGLLVDYDCKPQPLMRVVHPRVWDILNVVRPLSALRSTTDNDTNDAELYTFTHGGLDHQEFFTTHPHGPEIMTAHMYAWRLQAILQETIPHLKAFCLPCGVPTIRIAHP